MSDDDTAPIRCCPVCSGVLADDERVHPRCAPALITMFDDEADG
jgi:hypothetical protein